MEKNIYLMGFMGSGKTTVGKRLAKKLKTPFIDLDEYIEAKTGKSISEIFETKGEKHFRKLESQFLKELNSLSNHVISLGGGTPCQDRNWKWITEHHSIYLRVSQEHLVERLHKEKSRRPLIQNLKTKTALRLFIRELMHWRKPYYSRADHTVWNRGAIDRVVDKIMASVTN